MLELDRIGEYCLDSLLGRGATGLVYRARKSGSESVFALKAIRLDAFLEQEGDLVLERFRREAEIGMRLHHPGIVQVFEFVADEGTAALVMELVEGENLAHHAKGIGMEWWRALSVLKQLLSALSYAHGCGVIHRDVKPANIMLARTGNGKVKLADFGIAHLSNSTLTCVGDVVGTPAYMAPEQLNGGDVGPRTDVFSAGATLYALIAGRPPYLGSLPSVMQQVLYDEPERLSVGRSEIPKALDDILACAMAKDPAARFASAGAFIAALDFLAYPDDSCRPVQSSADETVILRRPKKTREPIPAVEELEQVLAIAISERVTENALDKARALCATLGAAQLLPATRTRIIDVCSSQLQTLADIASKCAPFPGQRQVHSRNDFISIAILMGLCRSLLFDLGADADSRIQSLSGALQEAVAQFATSLSATLAGEDNPNIADISADFMRLDVLQHGLSTLGADKEKQSLAAVEVLLVQQVMARVNSTLRRGLENGDRFARYEIALFLSEIEEMIVLAERLIARSASVASAFYVIGRQTLAEFVQNVGVLAESTVDELLRELQTLGGRVPTFGAQIKQVGLIYIFATRFADPGFQARLHELSARLYRRMEEVAAEIISRLKASLVANEPNGVRIHAEQIAAIHELARDAGWERLGSTLLSELRNDVVRDPSLRSLFVANAA
jgi:eukaryotic-like serine/threonine-protein kinase